MDQVTSSWSSLLGFMWHLYDQQMLCDVVVLTQDAQIGSHKLILGAGSETLHKFFVENSVKNQVSEPKDLKNKSTRSQPNRPSKPQRNNFSFPNDKSFYQKDFSSAMNFFDKNIAVENCKKKCESSKFNVQDLFNDDKYLIKKCLIKSQIPSQCEKNYLQNSTVTQHKPQNHSSQNPLNTYFENRPENYGNVILSQNTCFEKYKSIHSENHKKMSIPIPKVNQNQYQKTSYNSVPVSSTILNNSLQFHKREFSKLRKLEEQQKMKLRNMEKENRQCSFRPLQHLEKRMSRISSEKPNQEQFCAKVSGLRRNCSSKMLRLSEYEIQNESQQNEKLLSKLEEALERVEARKTTQDTTHKPFKDCKAQSKGKRDFDAESQKKEALLNKFFDALDRVESRKSSKDTIENFQNCETQSRKSKDTDSEFQKKEELLNKFVDALEFVELKMSLKNQNGNLQNSDVQSKSRNSEVQKKESPSFKPFESLEPFEPKSIKKHIDNSDTQSKKKKDFDNVEQASSPQNLSVDVCSFSAFKRPNDKKSKSTSQIKSHPASSPIEPIHEVSEEDLLDRNNNQNDQIVQFIPQILASKNDTTHNSENPIEKELMKNKSYAINPLLNEKVNNFLYKPDSNIKNHINEVDLTKNASSPTKNIPNNNSQWSNNQASKASKPELKVSKCLPKNNSTVTNSPLTFKKVSLKPNFSKLSDKKPLSKFQRKTHIQSFRANNVNKNAKSTNMFEQNMSNSASDISINLSFDSKNAYESDTQLLLPASLNTDITAEDRFTPQKTIEMFAVDKKTLNNFMNSIQIESNSNKNNNQNFHQNEQYSCMSDGTDDNMDDSIHRNGRPNKNTQSKDKSFNASNNSIRRKNEKFEDDFYINFLLNRVHQPTQPHHEVYEGINGSKLNQIESDSNTENVFYFSQNILSQKRNLRIDIDTPENEELSDGFYNPCDENHIKVIESSTCFQDQEFNIDIEGCENFNNKISFKDNEDDVSNSLGKLKLDVVNYNIPNDNYNINNNNNDENEDFQHQEREGLKVQKPAKIHFLDVLNSKSFIASINFVKRKAPINPTTQRQTGNVKVSQPSIQRKPNPPHRSTTTSIKKTTINHNYNNKNFDNPFQEQFIISMQKYSTQTVCCLLRFMYTGDASVIVNSNLKPLLHMSLELKISPLHRCCISFMVSTMQPYNVAGYLLLVDAYKMRNIKKVLFCHLLQNISEVLKETEFFELPLEWIVIILGDAESRRLIYAYCNDLSEEEVELMIFNGIVKWIDYERNKRMCHAPKLMSEVAHLEALSTKTLIEAVDTVDWLFKNQNIQEIILTIYKKKLAEDSECMKSRDVPDDVSNCSPDARAVSQNCSMFDCCTEEKVQKEEYCPHYFMPQKLRSSLNLGTCSNFTFV